MPIRTSLKWLLRWGRGARAEISWRLRGRPAPPPQHIKRAVLRGLAKSHGFRIFVETGTYYGETLSALRGSFDDLYSIELSEDFYRRATKRFRGDSKIHLWQGDSGEVLTEVLKLVDMPALFWLDGHYSGEPTAIGAEMTPIFRELKQISEQPLQDKHLIVVDDARLFNGTDGYPTMEEFLTEARRLGFTQIELANDMILLKVAH